MGNYGSPSTLPMTGAGVMIGGVLIDQAWLVILAACLIGTGALLIRFGFRSGLNISD